MGRRVSNMAHPHDVAAGKRHWPSGDKAPFVQLVLTDIERNVAGPLFTATFDGRARSRHAGTIDPLRNGYTTNAGFGG